MTDDRGMIDGRKVRAARLAKKWTQGDLSRATHPPIAVTRLSVIENSDRINLESVTAFALADALGMTVDDLRTEKGKTDGEASAGTDVRGVPACGAPALPEACDACGSLR